MVAASPILLQKKPSAIPLDRMAWPAVLRFHAFGVHIAIRSTSKDLLSQVLPILPAGRKASPSLRVDRLYSLFHAQETPDLSTGGLHFLYGDKRKLAQAERITPVIDALESDVNFHIAQASQRWVFVHAGAVGWKGRAVVIPGASFSGKSALVKELLALGAEYYSDEFAVFDSSGRAHAFPRRLCLRDERKSQTLVTAKQLGAKTGARPLPLGLVVVVRYRPGATWHPRLLSPGEAVLELLGNSLSGRSRPEHTLTVLTKAISRGLALSGVRGEARDTAVSILETFERARLM